jgi:hypothetical protein
MHSAQWTMIQYNPILIGSGGNWFDEAGRCTVNDEAGIKGDDDSRIDRAKIRRRGPRRLDRDQSDTEHGFPERAGIDVLLSPATHRPRQGRKSGDGGGPLLPAGAIPGRRGRQGFFDHLRLQPGDQRQGARREAGKACTISTSS